jgi:uncharacterized protein YjdB
VPDAPGHRSLVVGVSGGAARVVAADPATGIVSNEEKVQVLGALVALELRGNRLGPTVIPLGELPGKYVLVTGIFENGGRNLTYFGGRYVLESSDPTILAVVDDEKLQPLAPGVVEIVARDVTTGIASAPLTVTVRGALDQITLDPPQTTRGIGEWETFTAIGHWPPDFTDNLTQQVVYSSSDPSVAVADNLPPSRSRVRTVGAGTATITATYYPTGVSGTAVVTVLPGTIERLTIQPTSVVRNLGNAFSFTAIGHYPDGSTVNETQIVTWTSLAPDVAEATNESGDRSRIVARSVGTAGITALHPSGVGSHDSGDDGTFVAKALASLALLPVDHKGDVGDTFRYTLVGTFDDATTIDLTQDAIYWTDDEQVAVAADTPGDRSAVDLVGAGKTAVHAEFADWSSGDPEPSGSVTGAFLTVRPPAATP